MIQFILNNQQINTPQLAATPLLEFIRYHQHLTGTKTGCNEGDCGACTVLVGELINGEVRYRSMTSCLTPLANAQGKHIVTVEGINFEKPKQPANLPPPLNLIQQAMCTESATQCGFCTPGFVMSMAGFCLSGKEANQQNIVAAIDGNICRCTGYKSIERAAAKVAALMETKPSEKSAIDFVTEQAILPGYFKNIKERLLALAASVNGHLTAPGPSAIFVSGGTDLYVQKHDAIKEIAGNYLYDNQQLKGISQDGDRCIIGAATTVTDLLESPVMQQYFPDILQHGSLVSSTPIRNMATLAGNFINASPIGDFTIFFLALDAQLVLSNGTHERTIPLRQLYKGYKQLDKQPDEIVQKISFSLPVPNSYFSFEKVSKRTHLDIASVNSAMQIIIADGTIMRASISAGGVGPIPSYLANTSTFLIGKQPADAVVQEAIAIAQSEISPISDARGTAAYKRLLLGQLIKAHFLKLHF